jgi:hypothetical protein
MAAMNQKKHAPLYRVLMMNLHVWMMVPVCRPNKPAMESRIVQMAAMKRIATLPVVNRILSVAMGCASIRNLCVTATTIVETVPMKPIVLTFAQGRIHVVVYAQVRSLCLTDVRPHHAIVRAFVMVMKTVMKAKRVGIIDAFKLSAVGSMPSNVLMVKTA